MTCITQLLVHPVRIPRKFFSNARGKTTHIEAAIVEVQSDSGISGLGEADPLFPNPDILLEEIVSTIRRFLAPLLMGKDPRNIDSLRVEMDNVLTGHTLAKDAVEVALVDLAARLQNVPAAFILGGQFVDKVPVIAPLGIYPPGEMAREASDYVKRGFTGVKLKIGLEPALDVERIRAVREAVGPNVIMRADANASYSFIDALRTLRQIDRFNLQSIEQPLASWDLEGMSRLVRAVETPIMADESLDDAPSALEIIRRRAADIFHVKVQGKGGLLRARRIIALAEAAGIPCIIGQISEMSIGATVDATLAASTTNVIFPGEMAGPLIIDDDVVSRKLDLSRGTIELSAGPGFGLDLDRAALKRYEIALK
jgi:L-alanine-DL-glutamate epimerase-like enolase superfamily enzyme